MNCSNQAASGMLALNIPADGLFLAILHRANGDFSQENCVRMIQEYIGRYLDAKPDMILLNVCYRRSLTPSRVADSYLYDIPTGEDGYALRDENGETIQELSPIADVPSKYFASFFSCARKLLMNGIDIYQTAIEQIRHSGCQVFLSIRMNDGHYTDNPAVNSRFALKKNGIHTINRDGFALDFSQPAVQNHICEYIEELLQQYSVDGIELDWLRFPVVLPQAHRADFSILNGYMQRIRRLMDRHDPKLRLAVRVLPLEQDNLNNGVDVCQWISQGSADMVTIENFYIPANFEMPVFQWKSSIQKRNAAEHRYSLLCGSDWAVSCKQGYNIAMTPALVRGFACECISNGADGVYLFNFFEENDTSSFELTEDENGKAYLKNCFAQRIQAAREPFDLPRRYVHIGTSNSRYPIPLDGNSMYTFSYQLKKPMGKWKIIVGCDADASLSVSLNGSSTICALQGEAVPGEFTYIPETQIGQDNEFIYSVSQAAPHVKSAFLPEPPSFDQATDICIENRSSAPVQLLWIELLFDE